MIVDGPLSDVILSDVYGAEGDSMLSTFLYLILRSVSLCLVDEARYLLAQVAGAFASPRRRSCLLYWWCHRKVILIMILIPTPVPLLLLLLSSNLCEWDLPPHTSAVFQHRDYFSRLTSNSPYYLRRVEREPKCRMVLAHLKYQAHSAPKRQINNP